MSKEHVAISNTLGLEGINVSPQQVAAALDDKQAAAEEHPLWEAFLRFDRRRHCGKPDMDDDHDREVWEAFIEGARVATPNDPKLRCGGPESALTEQGGARRRRGLCRASWGAALPVTEPVG